MTKKLTGIQRQDAFLTARYSLPLHCPACGNYHSYIEARGSSDWSKQLPVQCPYTKESLVLNEPLMGGEQSFSLFNPREMSKE